MSEVLLSWINPEVACLTLNRPHAGNALNEAVLLQLTEHLELLASRDDLRALVLDGEGPHFCTGADLHWMRRSLEFSHAQNLDDAERLAIVLQRLDEFPAPVLALAKGSVFGGALGLISCADYVLASSDARFSLSEARLGLVPALISPYVVRAIGMRQARHYMLSAEIFDTASAVHLGLVHRQTATSALHSSRDQWLGHIHKGGPQACREIKTMLRRLGKHDGLLEEQPDNLRLIAKVRTSPEGQTGLNAFFNNRKPDWAL